MLIDNQSDRLAEAALGGPDPHVLAKPLPVFHQSVTSGCESDGAYKAMSAVMSTRHSSEL